MVTHQEQGSSGPRNRARRIDARRNLEAILEAARCVLPEDPRASMQEIAVAAGVHRATVHRHFASRDDLLAAVRARAFDATIAAVDESLAHGERPAIDAIERMAAAMLRVGDRFRLYRFTTWRDAEVDERVDEVGGVMTRLVAAAQTEGDARRDVPAESLAMVFGGLITSVLPQMASGAMTAEQGAAFIRAMLAAPQR
jgi:AcrR family transcriptional regulator